MQCLKSENYFQVISQGNERISSHQRNARRLTEVLASTRTFHFQREAQIRTPVIELLSWLQPFRVNTQRVCLCVRAFVCQRVRGYCAATVRAAFNDGQIMEQTLGEVKHKD